MTFKLDKLCTGTHERVGFILKDGTVVECKNISSDPENSFEVAAEEIVMYCDTAAATWHTHPGGDNNLSANDYETFVAWGNLDHWIIGTNGPRKYTVEGADVLIA